MDISEDLIEARDGDDEATIIELLQDADGRDLLAILRMSLSHASRGSLRVRSER